MARLEPEFNDDMPEVESIDPQEWKLLFMLLGENRSKIDFRRELTPYGIGLLDSLRRKLGIIVVGVDSGILGALPDYQKCEDCGQPKIYGDSHWDGTVPAPDSSAFSSAPEF